MARTIDVTRSRPRARVIIDIDLDMLAFRSLGRIHCGLFITEVAYQFIGERPGPRIHRDDPELAGGCL